MLHGDPIQGFSTVDRNITMISFWLVLDDPEDPDEERVLAKRNVNPWQNRGNINKSLELERLKWIKDAWGLNTIPHQIIINTLIYKNIKHALFELQLLCN